MGYLSDENRLLIELCYLAQMRQHETALPLGMTIRALEARRMQHRFRKSPESYLAALEEKLIKERLPKF